MSESNLPEAIGDIVADTYAILWPGTLGSSMSGGVVGKAVQALLKKRHDRAFCLLLEETRQGTILSRSEEEISDVLSMMLRYQRAAIEGAALLNLRMLARVFKGVSMSPILYPDKFLAWADVLSSLRQEEIIVLARVHEYTIKIRKEGPHGGFGPEYGQVERSLVPQPFQTENQVYAYCESVARTGLLMRQGDQNLFPFMSTPLMDELTNLVDFQEILEGEEIGAKIA